MDLIYALVESADMLVLGGDIFDFKWRRGKCLDEAVTYAISWLRNLATRNPTCLIQYVLGNHDSSPRFSYMLESLANENPSFRFYESSFRWRDCLFVHGDVPWVRNRSKRALQRAAYSPSKVRPRVLHLAYDLVVLLRFHNAVALLVNPHWLVLRRMRSHLHSLAPETRMGVRRVFFGHTHRVTPGKTFDGIQYFNGGAGVKGTRFEAIRI